jgi:hypothetical protein
MPEIIGDVVRKRSIFVVDIENIIGVKIITHVYIWPAI